MTAVKSFWQRMIFSGRGVPPVEKDTDEEVLSYVGANAGAIGYLSAGAALSDDVKKLEIKY